MVRIIAYIDGYNLYYGLREKGWKWFYWLNLQKLIQQLLKANQILVRVKYFTTIVKHPLDRNRRQAVFLEALQTLSDFDIYYGHFLSNPVTCHRCGHTYETHHEKMTDVNIAVEMLKDAFQNRCDTALLVSADSDLVGVIQAMRELFPSRRVIIAFPPAKFSDALKRVAHGYVHINADKLSKSVFPDEIVKPDGVKIVRPNKWH